MASLTNTNTIRILICDDSSVFRRLTREALKGDPRFQIVGEASNGKQALDVIVETVPDIVILDVEMPVMDGVDTVRNIRRRYPKLPVIMFSSITEQGSEATLDALDAGANDFVTKPSSVGSVNEALSTVRENLFPKILVLTGKNTTAKSKGPLAGSLDTVASSHIDAIGIGSSTGGPAALSQVFQKLPRKLSVPIFVTQHMPASFIDPLALRLARVSSVEVRSAKDGEEVTPNRILIAPGDRHLGLVRERGKVYVKLDDGPPVNSCRPAVDEMFSALAKCYGKKSLGIILTGMGKDGLLGAGKIKSNGGKILAQDKESSVVYGMPREVVEAGLADRVLPIDQIAHQVSQLVTTNHAIVNCST